jgi:hypothetical protein
LINICTVDDLLKEKKMYRPLTISAFALGLFIIMATSAIAQVPSDCNVSANTVARIRQMLTAPDNAVFFDLWSTQDIACACIELYYNDPADAMFHYQVIRGALVNLGKTADPRAVPVLIDAIDTYGPQALYALGNFPTVEALDALAANITNKDDESRENAAEGLRHMVPPPAGNIPDGWTASIKAAIKAVDAWLPKEKEPTFRDYFNDARKHLKELLSKATSAGTN